MPSGPTDVGSPLACPDCRTEVAPGLLSCPGCHRLVHSRELKLLVEEARAATDTRQALATWRSALDLLPPESSQHGRVLATVNQLSHELDRAPSGGQHGVGSQSNAQHTHPGLAKVCAGATGLALLLWKFKFVLTFLVTKGKLLILGLTKSSTLFSMLLSLGVYWTVWGWKFALGLVLSIYVHEMGHVFALRHYGIRASAPMFIPGVGALVRLKQYPANAIEEARVGLAGPLWGLGAAAACYAGFLATGWASLAAIAKVGAWINLFNLLPLWQLDGSRALRALDQRARGFCALALGAAWFFSEESLLLLLLVVAAIRSLVGPFPVKSDRRTLVEFVFLIAALTALAAVDTPIPI